MKAVKRSTFLNSGAGQCLSATEVSRLRTVEFVNHRLIVKRLRDALLAPPTMPYNARHRVRLLPLTPTKFVLASEQAGECSRHVLRVLKKLLISS